MYTVSKVQVRAMHAV